MKNISLMTIEEWMSHEVVTPLFLCQTPFSVSELEELTELSFEERIEDGLGTVYDCFVSIEGKESWFRGFLHREQKDECVTIEMHSSEPSPQDAIQVVLKFLSINKKQLKETGQYLDTPKYCLSRLDDNNNEVEICRLHHVNMAEHLKNVYEKRGHKQSYFVTQVED